MPCGRGIVGSVVEQFEFFLLSLGMVVAIKRVGKKSENCETVWKSSWPDLVSNPRFLDERAIPFTDLGRRDSATFTKREVPGLNPGGTTTFTYCFNNPKMVLRVFQQCPFQIAAKIVYFLHSPVFSRPRYKLLWANTASLKARIISATTFSR